MSNKAKTLEQMQDSQILYDKNLPPMSYFLLFTVLFLLAAVVVWSTITPKTYVVKGIGTVVSDEKNYIMSTYSGAISEALVSEGMYVNEGDNTQCYNKQERQVRKKPHLSFLILGKKE